MLKKSTLFISIVIILNMTNCSSKNVPLNPHFQHPCPDLFKLNEYHCRSASILPVFTENKELHLLLTRESEGRKNRLGKWHKYDDFSGGSEPEDMEESDSATPPALISACREGYEEGMIEETLGLTFDQFIEYIKNHTREIIVYSKDKNPCDPHSRAIRNVTYVVDFDTYKDQFFNNFYDARKKVLAEYEKEKVYQKHLRTKAEKDVPAKVTWNNFKAAILAQKDPNHIVYVDGLVLDPKTKKFRKEKIALRPFLDIKLHPRLAGNPYTPGENEKIRHYQG